MNSTDTKKRSAADIAVHGFGPLLAALLLAASAACIGWQYYCGDLPSGALSLALVSLTAVNAVCLLLAVISRGAALGFVRVIQTVLLVAELAAAGVLAACRFLPDAVEPYRALLGSGADTLTSGGINDSALILGLAAFAVLFRFAVLALSGAVARSHKGRPAGSRGTLASLLSVIAGLALAAFAAARIAGISFDAVPSAANANAALRPVSLDFAGYDVSDVLNLVLTVALPLFYVLFGLRAGRFSRASKKAAFEAAAPAAVPVSAPAEQPVAAGAPHAEPAPAPEVIPNDVPEKAPAEQPIPAPAEQPIPAPAEDPVVYAPAAPVAAAAAAAASTAVKPSRPAPAKQPAPKKPRTVSAPLPPFTGFTDFGYTEAEVL